VHVGLGHARAVPGGQQVEQQAPGYVTSVEQILETEAGRRLAYTVVGGIPVRNYRAEVTLTPDDGGTRRPPRPRKQLARPGTVRA
jgi:hypothetical protein